MRLFLIGVLVAVLNGGIQAKDIDVILIGGQSNASGQGLVRNIPSSFKVSPKVELFYSRYLNRGEGSEKWGGLRGAGEVVGRFGPELTLGTSLQKFFPNRNIAIIKHSLGGSNLCGQWNPGNKGNQKEGAEYAKLIEAVNKGMNHLRARGDRPVLRAMVWQQGEADARDLVGMKNSKAYGENLKNFIEQVRKALGAPNMPFVLGTVMPMPAARFPGRDMVKEAQRKIDEKSGSPLAMKGVYVVEADDLQMLRSDFNSPDRKDDVHLGTFGQLDLGDRFAQKIRQVKAME